MLKTLQMFFPKSIFLVIVFQRCVSALSSGLGGDESWTGPLTIAFPCLLRALLFQVFFQRSFPLSSLVGRPSKFDMLFIHEAPEFPPWPFSAAWVVLSFLVLSEDQTRIPLGEYLWITRCILIWRDESSSPKSSFPYFQALFVYAGLL